MLGIFLDIETTGLDPTKHCVIDIAFKIIDLSSGKLRNTFSSVVKPSSAAWSHCDPISLQINGYTWEQVSLGLDPKFVGEEIIHLFTAIPIERGKAVFICQNPAFDRGFFTQLVDVYTQEKLNWPYHWLDLASMYWAIFNQKTLKEGVMLPEKMSLSKNDIAKGYNLSVEADPHRAMNGVDHLILCYKAVLGVTFES